VAVVGIDLALNRALLALLGFGHVLRGHLSSPVPEECLTREPSKGFRRMLDNIEKSGDVERNVSVSAISRGPKEWLP
jgi:hypothetical protein